MKKTTIIYGPAQTGKSRLANAMVPVDANVCRIDCKGLTAEKLRHRFFFQSVEAHTTLILLDDVPQKLLSRVMTEFYDSKLWIEKRGQIGFEIEKPEAIITVESETPILFPDGASFAMRFNIIHLNSIEDYNREYAKIFNSIPQ